MKAVLITKENQEMLVSRYAGSDIGMFPIGYVMVTGFGDNGDFRYDGVLTPELFNEKFIKIKELRNGFWDIVSVNNELPDGPEEPNVPTTYSDDFTYPDGLLTAVAPNKWIGGIAGHSSPYVFSNHLKDVIGIPDNAAIYNGTFSRNQYSQANVISPEACYPGVITRAHVNSDFVRLGLDSNGFLQMYKHVSGVWDLVNEMNVFGTSGVIRLESQGNTHMAYFNGGLQMSVLIEDTELSDGVPGVYIYNGGQLDNWIGGDL